MPSPSLLGPLDAVPVGPDLVHIPDPGFPEHVRMPPDELVHQGLRDLIQIVRLALSGQLTMEHDLEEEIPQLLGHLVIIAGLDGVEEFIDFLHGMEPEAAVILFPVPWATTRRTQDGHDLLQLADG